MVGKASSSRSLNIGDEVAVLMPGTRPKVMEIRQVESIGPAIIELDDRKLYYTMDGKGMDNWRYIVPATDEHRAALLEMAR